MNLIDKAESFQRIMEGNGTFLDHLELQGAPPGIRKGIGDAGENAAQRLAAKADGKKDAAKDAADAIPKLNNQQIEDLAKQLHDGQIKPKHLKKRGISPEDIAEIQKKALAIRPREHDIAKIIEDITKSKKRVDEALEEVKQNPKDVKALEKLEETQKQLAEIRAEYERLKRMERNFE